MEFIKKNEQKWRTRNLQECTKRRELDKEERLAIAKEKKKRYGIKTLSQEESKRLKTRTEERIEIAQAKANYWKWYRGGGEKRKGEKKNKREEDMRDAWTRMKVYIVALEEEGEWILEEDEIKEKENRMKDGMRSADDVDGVMIGLMVTM